MINGIKTIYKNGIIVWEHPKTGKDHRLNGPAYINIYGYRDYRINGEWHNINGPAKMWENGVEYWINGMGFRKHKWLLISLKRKLIQKKKY